MMRCPAEFFIKYLLVEGHTDDEVVAELRSGELDALDVGYLAGLREKLTPPRPFFPRDPRHVRSQRFLVHEQIRELVHPDRHIQAARQIWRTPRAREFAETMLLLKAPPEAIGDVLTRQAFLTCSKGAVERYAHFFWNVSLFTGTGMRTYLAWRTERLADDPTKAALLRASENVTDPRRIAADRPFSPLAAMLAQMRLGMAPVRINLAARVASVAELAAARAEEALWGDKPSDAARARDFATTARIFREMEATMVKPTEHLREQLREVSLRRDPARLPSLHALSAGHHTADLQPTEANENDDK